MEVELGTDAAADIRREHFGKNLLRALGFRTNVSQNTDASDHAHVQQAAQTSIDWDLGFDEAADRWQQPLFLEGVSPCYLVAACPPFPHSPRSQRRHAERSGLPKPSRLPSLYAIESCIQQTREMESKRCRRERIRQ